MGRTAGMLAALEHRVAEATLAGFLEDRRLLHEV